MVFIIAFSRQQQLLLHNWGNLTKGKQISLLLDTIKYLNGNSELQSYENSLRLTEKENVTFHNWTKPSKTCIL